MKTTEVNSLTESDDQLPDEAESDILVSIEPETQEEQDTSPIISPPVTPPDERKLPDVMDYAGRWWWTVAVTVLLSVVSAASVLTLRVSKTSTEYMSTTAVLSSEVLKVTGCLAVVGCKRGTASPVYLYEQLIKKPRGFLLMAFPAFLYVLINNLSFFAMERLDAALFQVTFQGKMLSTAICSMLILGRKFSKQQWLALLILAVGVCIAQDQKQSAKVGHALRSETALGVIAIVVADLLIGLAGVYTEKLLKAPDADLWIQNLQMGLWSILIALVSVFAKDREKVEMEGFFSGYTSIVWITVLLRAGMGILVSMVMKFADTIAKNFSVAVSMLLSTVVSIPLFGFQPSAFFILGSVLVFLSVIMYNTNDFLANFREGARSAVAAFSIVAGWQPCDKQRVSVCSV